MRIGIFTDSYKPYICGVTTSVEMLKKGLTELGHEVFVICMKLTNEQNVNFIDEENVIRINGIRLKKKGLEEFRLSFFNNVKVKKLFKYDFDIVHIHTEFSIGKLGLLYAKNKKIPVVYTSHTMFEDYFGFISRFLSKYANKQMIWGLKKLLNLYMSKASYTIIPTKKTQDKLMSYNLISNYQIIPTGIDVNSFNPNNINVEKKIEIRQKLNLSKDDFVFLYLGRISQEKSIEVLVESFNNLKNIHAKLIIVGDGLSLANLKEIAENNPNIIFVGKVSQEEVKYYYNIADCFLNASSSETQGLTYIEALASGLPVILKKDSVLDDLIIENENGLLFETSEQLIEKMQMVYYDKKIREILSKNAIKSVEKYSKECYTNAVINLYYSLLPQ